jgi:hypothetical protein
VTDSAAPWCLGTADAVVIGLGSMIGASGRRTVATLPPLWRNTGCRMRRIALAADPTRVPERSVG